MMMIGADYRDAGRGRAHVSVEFAGIVRPHAADAIAVAARLLLPKAPGCMSGIVPRAGV